MSGDVKLLDQNTANQIAAGEVVEKPASVIKELVENSLDAGASSIEVTIYEGGIEFMRVVDNGYGMTEANARLAVLRHATSKISKAQDLLYIKTLGFRGEALPSIASVSNFHLLTRPKEQELATSIVIEGGSNMAVEEAGGAVGTSITVKNLFFNVPARRKFLRTINTESRYISDVMGKMALSRPDVHFTLFNNEKEVINTPGSGELLDTVAALYGKKVAEETLPVKYETEEIKLEGYIGKPTLLKGNRQWQTIFVNGRVISSKMISKALDHAYQSQIPKAGFPFVVLNILLDTESLDVNVHPQKSEVKFGDEGMVYRAVYHGLCEALTGPLRFGQPAANCLEAAGPKIEMELRAKNASTYREPAPFALETNRGYATPTQEIWKRQEPLIDTTTFAQAQHHSQGSLLEEEEEQELTQGVASLWPLGQVGRTFIIAQAENALYLIDQHAAHERIMYDRFIRCQEEIPVQNFLVPIFVEVLKDQVQLVEEYKDTFLELGVDASAAGETLLRISALPADVENGKAEDFIKDIINYLEGEKKVTPRDLREEVLHYAACHSAIRAGEVLTIRQMRQVIDELLHTEHPFTCPHGRPCMLEVTMEELFKMFKRT